MCMHMCGADDSQCLFASPPARTDIRSDNGPLWFSTHLDALGIAPCCAVVLGQNTAPGTDQVPLNSKQYSGEGAALTSVPSESGVS